MLKPSRGLPIPNPSRRNVRCFPNEDNTELGSGLSLSTKSSSVLNGNEVILQQSTSSGRREEEAEDEMEMENEEDEHPPAFHFSKHHLNLPRRKSTRLD
jgi:hypothetical protein